METAGVRTQAAEEEELQKIGTDQASEEAKGWDLAEVLMELIKGTKAVETRPSRLLRKQLMKNSKKVSETRFSIFCICS